MWIVECNQLKVVTSSIEATWAQEGRRDYQTKSLDSNKLSLSYPVLLNDSKTIELKAEGLIKFNEGLNGWSVNCTA